MLSPLFPLTQIHRWWWPNLNFAENDRILEDGRAMTWKGSKTLIKVDHEDQSCLTNQDYKLQELKVSEK